MTRRDLLKILISSPIACSIDVERLLWVPTPHVTVPAVRKPGIVVGDLLVVGPDGKLWPAWRLPLHSIVGAAMQPSYDGEAINVALFDSMIRADTASRKDLCDHCIEFIHHPHTGSEVYMPDSMMHNPQDSFARGLTELRAAMEPGQVNHVQARVLVSKRTFPL